MRTNNGNHGKKGRSGRKSAYQERADARDAEAIFFGEHDQEVLEHKIQRGKFSLKDRFILNGMEGDTIALNTIVRKVFPDKTKLQGDLDNPIPIQISEVIAKKHGFTSRPTDNT